MKSMMLRTLRTGKAICLGEIFRWYVVALNPAHVKSCPPGSPIFDLVPDLFGEVQSSPIWAQQQLAFRVPGAKGGFIHDHQAAMDLCVNPELLWQHGNYLTQQPTQVNFRRNYLYPGKHSRPT